MNDYYYYNSHKENCSATVSSTTTATATQGSYNIIETLKLKETYTLLLMLLNVKSVSQCNNHKIHAKRKEIK